MSNTLTIGMSTYDDFDGVFFTICSLKTYQNLQDVNILVIDNNPNSVEGKTTKQFIESINATYIPFEEKKSTSVRNEIFKQSTGKYTLCMDCHVLLCSNFIDNLLRYYSLYGSDCKNIISGPLMNEQNNVCSTHFDPVWRNHMYGIWGFDKDKYNLGKPFEIPMMGLGLFSCETKNWLGFNEYFKGFGAEEGYIHEKFRLNGGKAICVPQLKWLHRFYRPRGVSYPLNIEDRVWNYFIGWLELKNDPNDKMMDDIKEHFYESMNKESVDKIFEESVLYHEKAFNS
jgi:hypothetical protein